MRRRGKLLSEAELALWRQVARTVKPLAGRKPVEPEPEAEQAKPAPAAENVPSAAMLAPVRPPAKPAPPPLVPLERRMRTQLRRGQQGVEAVIDLHGLRQEEAHTALRGFLRLHFGRHLRVVDAREHVRLAAVPRAHRVRVDLVDDRQRVCAGRRACAAAASSASKWRACTDIHRRAEPSACCRPQI